MPVSVTHLSWKMRTESPSDPVLAALRASGSRIRRIRYRRNRTVLVSVSRDGVTLNTHECFRGAPARVVHAIATFVRAPRRSAEYRRALDIIRTWEGAAEALERVRRERPRRSTRSSDDAASLRALFDAYNRDHFGGRLPRVPMRVSRRMTRALGTIAYGEDGGVRKVREIVISADLLLPANAEVLRDTLLHEMAHGEAWLRHGHRGHGKIWRRIAERVGCVPRALTQTRVARHRRNRGRAVA
jgi:hypothetical protein